LASLGLVYVFDQSNPVRSQSARELAHTFVTITTISVTGGFIAQPSQLYATNAQVFSINGNMSVAASGRGGLMVRVPPDETEKLVARDHVEPMVMAGRETRGWLRVSVEGVKTKRQLQAWVTRGVDYAKSLPPK
jgi:hypothetical protein